MQLTADRKIANNNKKALGIFVNSVYQPTSNFYARQLYRQVLLRARISYGDSVCPSVWGATTRYRI